jgi:hypothetical protein
MKKIIRSIASVGSRPNIRLALAVIRRIIILGLFACVILPEIWYHVVPVELRVNSSYLDLVCASLLSYIFVTQGIDKEYTIVITDDHEDV